jgi:methylmalonyl-CoA epimerase
MDSVSIDHIGVATPSIRRTAPVYERMTGLSCSPIEELPEHGVNIAFIGTVELLEPHGPDSGLHRFLEQRGPGLHHVAFQVKDLPAELRRLTAEGFRLIDQAPRTGAGGHLVAFVHPKSMDGTLWELVQR